QPRAQPTGSSVPGLTADPPPGRTQRRTSISQEHGRLVLLSFNHRDAPFALVEGLTPRSWAPRAVLSRPDLGALSNPGFFNYGVESHEAYRRKALSSDIVEEQKKLQEADLVIFQFPLYWFSVPAILKGWMDRVLCQGFAFDFPGFYDDGFLKGKLAVLSFTTGGTAEMYSKTGVRGDFRYFLWPLQHGTLHFCGLKVLAPQVSFGPEYASEEERRGMVAAWAQRLKTIWEEEPIDCSPPWYFGP
uniref:Ribosyldihydronicotinamide dehydrogenase [quinone] n=1 Tax=Sus scrofa TaxID=9823 RepID=A0A8D1W8V7_PIG